MYQIYGRTLSVARPDGTTTLGAVFYASERLYMLEASGPSSTSSDRFRFLRSLSFDRNVKNRTKEQLELLLGGVYARRQRCPNCRCSHRGSTTRAARTTESAAGRRSDGPQRGRTSWLIVFDMPPSGGGLNTRTESAR